MRISKIISGAQTGADRGGLDAAIYCDIPYGGWVLKGRKSEDGVIPEKDQGFQETSTDDYFTSTKMIWVDHTG